MKNRIITIVLGMVLISIASPDIHAAKSVGSTSRDECVTGTERDTDGLKFSIRKFVNFFNESASKQYCRNKIQLRHDITLEKPLVLTGQVNQGDPQIKKFGMVLDGADPDTGKPHVISTSKITGKCAIDIQSNNVLVRNLVIQGNKSITIIDENGKYYTSGNREEVDPEAVGKDPLDTAGLCISGTDNGLSNVIVSNIPGTGIKIKSANGLVLDERTISVRNSGPGIDISKKTVATTGYLSSDFDSSGGDAFARLSPNIVVFGNGNDWNTKQILVDRPYVDIQMRGIIKGGGYDVSGYVFKDGVRQAAYMLTLYLVQPDIEKDVTELGITDVSPGYILGPKVIPDAGFIPAGLQKFGDAKMEENGRFQFLLKDAKNVSQIFVVAYPENNIIGTASETIKVAFGDDWYTKNWNNGKFAAPRDGTGNSNSGNNNGNNNPTYQNTEVVNGVVVKDDTHLYTKTACLEELGGIFNNPTTSLCLFDSDDDGIVDCLEDISSNCVGDGNETDLRNPDSDNDGLLDSLEDENQNGFVDCYMPFNGNDTTVCNLPGDNTVAPLITRVGDDRFGKQGQLYCLVYPEFRTEDDGTLVTIPGGGRAIPKFLNEGKATGFNEDVGFCTETNPRKRDSDGDSLNDGEEDSGGVLKAKLRNRLSGEKLPAHYYSLDGSGKGLSTGSPIKLNGTHLTCEVSSKMQNVGIEYEPNWIPPAGFYGVTESDEVEITPLNVVCKYDIAAEDTSNFNGEYEEGRGESDPRLADTDGDQLCDGQICTTKLNGAGLPINLGSDACPEVDDPFCADQCWTGKIVAELPTGSTLQEVRSMLNDATFENKEMLDVLGGIGLQDSDGDGIPDIIENTNGACSPGSLKYDPTKSDSDGDGIEDSIDACPSVNNNLVPCVVDKKRLQKVKHSDAPVLACYIDSDGDGLFDCQEDKDLNGDIDVYAGESDPFNSDTNSNGIPDGVEANSGSKFPGLADEDNDGDGIPNFVEMSASGDPAKYNAALSADRGCAEAIQSTPNGNISLFDTNPDVADTDGDGINDGKEVQYGYNPNNPDSDQDGLCDGGINVPNTCDATLPLNSGNNSCICLKGEDMNGDGVTPKRDSLNQGGVNESDPCNGNTDGDIFADGEDTCKNSEFAFCANPSLFGPDQDDDGLPDATEQTITGTDPTLPDTDGDGLIDGCERDSAGEYVPGTGELCNQLIAGKPSSNFKSQDKCGQVPYFGCDTNPLVKDTDNDYMTDNIERKYGTNPVNKDTDGDCILDGIEDARVTMLADGSAQVDLNSIDGEWTGCTEQVGRNGKAGLVCTELNALDSDTDGDGLPDGRVGNLGEDLDCNGVQNRDASGLVLETSPLAWDTDADGYSDFDEMTQRGGFNIQGNIARSVTGNGQGCTLLVTSEPSTQNSSKAAWIIMILFGMPLAVLARKRTLLVESSKR